MTAKGIFKGVKRLVLDLLAVGWLVPMYAGVQCILQWQLKALQWVESGELYPKTDHIEAGIFFTLAFAWLAAVLVIAISVRVYRVMRNQKQ